MSSRRPILRTIQDHVAAFGGCPNDFYLGSVRREQAIGERDESEQNDDCDSTEDEATGPGGRFSATVAHGMVDAQTLEIVVFGVRGHCNQLKVTKSAARASLLRPDFWA